MESKQCKELSEEENPTTSGQIKEQQAQTNTMKEQRLFFEKENERGERRARKGEKRDREIAKQTKKDPIFHANKTKQNKNKNKNKSKSKSKKKSKKSKKEEGRRKKKSSFLKPPKLEYSRNRTSPLPRFPSLVD